ncbi:hypothetical protein QQ045_028526 [Rhodiola kirilowii]
MEEKNHLPWSLKRILRLRDTAKKCIDIDQNLSLKWKGPSNEFQVRGAYSLLAEQGNIHPWTNLVWGKLSAPKHSFCCWLAVQKRLPTLDNLRTRQILNVLCCWCSQVQENNDHLFFSCPNMLVLRPLLQKLHLNGNWEDLIQWSETMSWRDKAQKELAFFIINATVFEVWRNRNNTIFRGDKLDPLSIQTRIWRMLQMKIETIKNKKKWISIQKYSDYDPVSTTD